MGMKDTDTKVLPLKHRFAEALHTWDPLKDVRPLRWADPPRPDGKISFIRWLIITLILLVPPIVLSLLTSQTAGGGFFHNQGMKKDFYFFFSQGIFFPSILLIVLYGRRALGDMINQVKIVYGVAIPIDSNMKTDSFLLKVLEWLSRLNPLRLLLWLLLFLAINALSFVWTLKDNYINWISSPSEPGSFFYFARIGSEQPNFAGLYTMFVSGLVVSFYFLLLARLIIVFSISCSQLAVQLEGRIMPAHPDNTGGLLPVGKVALLFSFPIMLIGLGQTVITLQEIYIWGKSFHWSVPVSWGFYLVLCPLFFLLPVLPLHQVMFTSKRKCLFRLQDLYRSLDCVCDISFKNDQIQLDQMEKQLAVSQLIEKVSGMFVWPFDRKTVKRFFGFVVSPIVPILVSEAPHIIRWVVGYLSPQ
jgi:hypothetical protein